MSPNAPPVPVPSSSGLLDDAPAAALEIASLLARAYMRLRDRLAADTSQGSSTPPVGHPDGQKRLDRSPNRSVSRCTPGRVPGERSKP